jgi:hypothetical protein
MPRQAALLRRPAATDWRLVALYVVVLGANFLPREVASPFIVLVGLGIAATSKIRRSFLAVSWPLMALFSVGFIGIAGHDVRDVLRDISFAATPVSLLLIGYWVVAGTDIWHVLPKHALVLGLIFAISHLSAFIVEPSLLTADSMVIRAAAGSVSEIAVLAIFIATSMRQFGTSMTRRAKLFRYLALPILAVSVFLSFSRTSIVVLVVAYLCLQKWPYRARPRVFLLVAGGLVALLVSLGTLGEAPDEVTFSGKFLRAITEVAVSDYDNFQDISANWRGFETFKAIEAYLSGQPYQLVMGQGFGALVDLGFFMRLGGDVEFRYIPVLHNGYAYVLLKYGVFGIVMYFIFFSRLIQQAWRKAKSRDSSEAFGARFLMGCAINLMLAMFVVGGPPELGNSELVLLVGILAGKLNILRPPTPASPVRLAFAA